MRMVLIYICLYLLAVGGRHSPFAIRHSPFARRHERNQQGDNPNLSKIRVLKNRYSGMTGVTTNLKYDPSTGRLEEIEVDDEGNPMFQDETYTQTKDSSQVHGADDVPF